jgi:hypothetical protein
MLPALPSWRGGLSSFRGRFAHSLRVGRLDSLRQSDVWFYGRLLALRTCRDLYLIAAVVLLSRRR